MKRAGAGPGSSGARHPLGLLAAGALLLIACSPVNPSPTAGPTPVPPASPTAVAAPTPAGPTADSLGAAGKAVFAENCARCHGDQGEGVTAPANIGPNAHLDKFSTGKGLYDYISTTMPQDRPATLSPETYLQVVSFLLLQNGFVQPNTLLSADTLATVRLQR